MAFEAKFYHTPILAEKCLQLLNIKSDGIYVDCTAGGGGHSALILERLSKNGRLIAFDKDDEAIAHCGERFGGANNFELIKSDFKNAPSLLKEKGFAPDGILMDLGLSSRQIDEQSRGFSYMSDDAPLDMRMDREQSLTAEEIVNTYDEKSLYEILRDYGEEKFAKNIAKNIALERSGIRIKTTGELKKIIEKSIPSVFKKTGGHPAKRSFQALRIAVNGELDGLREAVTELTLSLKPGGRIVVLTFHSLEDRIVKQAFGYLEADCVCDKNAPICICGKKREIKILAKALVPDQKEIEENSRAASAKLRAAEKL